MVQNAPHENGCVVALQLSEQIVSIVNKEGKGSHISARDTDPRTHTLFSFASWVHDLKGAISRNLIHHFIHFIYEYSPPPVMSFINLTGGGASQRCIKHADTWRVFTVVQTLVLSVRDEIDKL